MYNASKQALRVLTEGLRHELAAAGDDHIKASVSFTNIYHDEILNVEN
jgi:NAD(P)-dependent dehydrogenase (short-subunit alcohol dehydrogenase family)